MVEPVASLYENGLERYKNGESAESLIPVFKEICDRSKKNATAWSSLAWLYLLVDKPQQALKAAQKGVKLDKNSPQGRINLAIALLETETKGVREQIEIVQRVMSFSSEIRQELAENIEDGLTRKPDWASLIRVKNWLFT
jgi:predicted Zn-dependent protease